jgi:hypothetical protein
MNQMMIVRVLFLVVILLGLAQLMDWVPAGMTSVWTWLHIIAGLALVVLIERIWSARTRA